MGKFLSFSSCLFLVFMLGTGWGVQQTQACTSVIISGRVTPDGRPLMWKHRDTGTPFNHMAFFDDGGYRFLGLVNSDSVSAGVWTGSNETGFCIMNTASYNLKDDEVQEMDREGRLMEKALRVCRTVADFGRFLDTLPRPMGVEANFGVIDAFGGAAYFETKNDGYFKKDVNDPQIAPEGYLIYTNFSFEGRKDEGMGYIRYDNATAVFRKMKPEGYTPRHILRDASRSFYNSLLGIDLKDEEWSPNRANGWFVEQDVIPRRESTAAIVIQGVKPGTDPQLTTLWTALGYPPTAVALPLWVKMGRNQPALTSYDPALKTAPLCMLASQLKDKVYSVHRGNGLKYMHWSLLWNGDGGGYMQRLQETEEKVFGLFLPAIGRWERNGLDSGEVQQLYQRATCLIRDEYARLE